MKSTDKKIMAANPKSTDKKIIAANPDATPHELLTVYGLSEAGFNALVAQSDTEAQQAQNAKPPKLVPQNILKPTMQPIVTAIAGNTGRVRIVPINGSGIGTEMSRTEAEKMVKRHPTVYKIV